MSLFLSILLLAVWPCYSQYSNPVVVNNGEAATLYFNISAFISEDIIYVNDPHYNIVGIYTDNKMFIFSQKYNTTGRNSKINDSLIEITIPHVEKFRHAGRFTCGFGHRERPLPNCGELLVVRDIPTKPEISLRQLAVYGHNVTIRCSSNSTTLPQSHSKQLRYKWFQDGLRLKKDAFSPVAAPRLTLNVTHRGAHQFECIAREGTLKTNRSSIEFRPEYSPYDISIKSFVRIGPVQGLPFAATCLAICRPACMYQWSRHGKPCLGTENGILHFPSIAKHQAGVYNCTASNVHGSQEASIVLDVQSLPESPKGLAVLSLTDESVTVSWTKGDNSEAKQRFEITMTSLGKEPRSLWTDENTTTATFDNLQHETEYTIRVRARNDFGTSDYSGILRVRIGSVTITTPATPKPHDKEAPMLTGIILGIIGISLTILTMGFFVCKGPARRMRICERRQFLEQQAPIYEGAVHLSEDVEREHIYDEIHTEMSDTSAVYLRKAATMSTSIRHVDPRRTISVV